MLIEEMCPRCGYVTRKHRNPVPTVDIIIEISSPTPGLVLIDRANPPYGWALPGGFVDYGESLEDAARREAREETGLEVNLLGQFHTYSDPRRDPRQHTITTVYVAQGHGQPRADDDARRLAIFGPDQLPPGLAFDHEQILHDYLKVRPQWLPLLKTSY
jgi:8-oxo-dGTP diphosphatase